MKITDAIGLSIAVIGLGLLGAWLFLDVRGPAFTVKDFQIWETPNYKTRTLPQGAEKL